MIATLSDAIPLIGRELKTAVNALGLGDYLDSLQVSEAGAYLGLKHMGLSLAAKERKWARTFGLTEGEVGGDFFVVGFHFHADGHEGYQAFGGQLWKEVRFGMSPLAVIAILGEPSMRGGGGISAVVGGTVPKWMKYTIEPNTELHCQFSTSERLELVTLGRSRLKRR